jgi:hypothetical protein
MRLFALSARRAVAAIPPAATSTPVTASGGAPVRAPVAVPAPSMQNNPGMHLAGLHSLEGALHRNIPQQHHHQQHQQQHHHQQQQHNCFVTTRLSDVSYCQQYTGHAAPLAGYTSNGFPVSDAGRSFQYGGGYFHSLSDENGSTVGGDSCSSSSGGDSSSAAHNMHNNHAHQINSNHNGSGNNFNNNNNSSSSSSSSSNIFNSSTQHSHLHSHSHCSLGREFLQRTGSWADSDAAQWFSQEFRSCASSPMCDFHKMLEESIDAAGTGCGASCGGGSGGSGGGSSSTGGSSSSSTGAGAGGPRSKDPLKLLGVLSSEGVRSAAAATAELPYVEEEEVQEEVQERQENQEGQEDGAGSVRVPGVHVSPLVLLAGAGAGAQSVGESQGRIASGWRKHHVGIIPCNGSSSTSGCSGSIRKVGGGGDCDACDTSEENAGKTDAETEEPDGAARANKHPKQDHRTVCPQPFDFVGNLGFVFAPGVGDAAGAGSGKRKAGHSNSPCCAAAASSSASSSASSPFQ